MLLPSDFLGQWRVDRRIEDRRAQAHAGAMAGRFSGEARFAPDGAGLRYHEAGTLTLDAEGTPAMAAERQSLWLWDAGGVEVRFGDGRPFHRFVPEGAGPGTDHPCGPDLYRVAYSFREWPRWSATWRVEGPAKSYVLRTAYTRA